MDDAAASPDFEAITAGDRPAYRRGVDALRRASDADARAALLDPLALAAGAGSVPALTLLLWAVDELGLARPAIRRLLVADAEVDEVAQDVLVAVAETIGGYRAEARFTTWLHQVARFKAIAHLRRKRPTGTLPDDERLGDAARISSIIATRTSVETILRELPEAYRGPVVLRDIEHLPYDELARRLDLNLNTAKARVARGRALVAARLGDR
ncbi:MAG: sigma-70 family RNA polymerase sigma factor [Acidimicrobiales bacterium]